MDQYGYELPSTDENGQVGRECPSVAQYVQTQVWHNVYTYIQE